jgi:hypothetical protein
MRSGSGAFRKSGGLFVLLAFLLSLLPAATQSAVAAVPNQRLVAQLAESLAFEAAATATIPQAGNAADRNADEVGGDGSALPQVQAIAASESRRGEHVLPPATAPPASRAAHAYQARAPPVR